MHTLPAGFMRCDKPLSKMKEDCQLHEELHKAWIVKCIVFVDCYLLAVNQFHEDYELCLRKESVVDVVVSQEFYQIGLH